MAARRAHNPKVVGSSPTYATKIRAETYSFSFVFLILYADVAELVDAPDSKSKWIFLMSILKSTDKYTGLGFGRI